MYCSNVVIRSSTALIYLAKNGNTEFCYDKVHLPPAEFNMGVCYGSGIGKETGVISREINPKWKYMRTAGFGGALVRNDDFISNGIRKDLY